MRLLAAAAGATALLLPAVPADAAAAPRGAAVAQALAAVQREGLQRDSARVIAVRSGLAGLHVRGIEVRGGVPVDGTGWVVTSRRGKVVDVAVDRSRLAGRPVSNPISRTTALQAAGLAVGAMRPLRVSTQRTLVARNGRLADVFRVSLVSLRPAVVAAVDVSAASGRVLAVRDDAKRIDVTGKLFNPSPTVARKDTKLRQPLEMGLPADPDLDSAELTAARSDVPLRGLDEIALTAGRLVGPHANVISGGYNVFVNRSVLRPHPWRPAFRGRDGLRPHGRDPALLPVARLHRQRGSEPRERRRSSRPGSRASTTPSTSPATT